MRSPSATPQQSSNVGAQHGDRPEGQITGWLPEVLLHGGGGANNLHFHQVSSPAAAAAAAQEPRSAPAVSCGRNPGSGQQAGRGYKAGVPFQRQDTCLHSAGLASAGKIQNEACAHPQPLPSDETSALRGAPRSLLWSF